MASISIENLRKEFGGNAVLQNLSLHIPDGAFFTLLGPSGCGKTTLLRCIAGFYESDGGRILFDQDEMTHVPTHHRDIGMVFQDYALFPDKSAFENVAYGLRARKVARAEINTRAKEALESVGLAHLADRYPAQMSGGQRQRVALARALVIRPRVLLMDEPLSNLDAKMRMQMRDIILDLVQEARITTVFVTHDQEEALAMSDKIALMDKGCIAQLGTPEELYGLPENAYVADFIGSANVIPVTAGQGTTNRGEPLRFTLGGQELHGRCGADTITSDALLLARPEHIDLKPPAEAVDNRVAGVILRRQYLGYKTSYRVRINDAGQEVRVDLSTGHHAASFQPGDHVQVVFPENCRVIPASGELPS